MVNIESSTQPNVLVIDDEYGTRESLRFALQDDYAVKTAESVELGLAYLGYMHFDAVVLDLQLPDIDGIEGLRRIRQMDSEVAVVILTAFGSLATAQAAIQLGANDYQLKPFDVPDFLTVVKKNVMLTQAARRYQKLATDLERINRNLTTELQYQNRAVYAGQLSAGMMHDIGGPLSGLSIHLDLIRSAISRSSQAGEDLYEDVLTQLDRAEHSVSLIWDMVASFKSLCNGSHGNQSAVDIDEVIRDIMMVLRPVSLANRSRLVTHSATNGEGIVQGDRLQIFRALMNIINNAIDAAEPESGNVHVDSRLDEGFVVVEISDDGPGIAPDDVDRVCERFFTTKQDGTGLGMFIAQSVAHTHGGTIHLESEVDMGTTAILRLPRLHS